VGYQCLTGAVPFDGEDSFSIGYKHIMEEVPTPELKTAEQRELFQIIKRMMAKTPEERFEHAEELVKVLGGAPMPAAGKASAVSSSAATTMFKTPPPTTGKPSGAPLATPTTPTTPIPRTDPKLHREPAKKKGGGGVLVGFILFLLLGGGGGGGYYWFVLKPQQDLAAHQVAAAPPSAPADTQAAHTDSSAVAAPAPSTPAAPTATTGGLLFAGLPRGARVLLDNAVVRLDADSVGGLEPHSYSIVIKATGYEDFKTNAAVRRGAQVSHCREHEGAQRGGQSPNQGERAHQGAGRSAQPAFRAWRSRELHRSR